VSIPFDIKTTIRVALMGKTEEADKAAASCDGWFSQFWADKAKDLRAAQEWLDVQPADFSARIVSTTTEPAAICAGSTP
jgi:hypothetical protein